MLTASYQHVWGADQQLSAGVLGVLTVSYQHVYNAATLESNSTLGMLSKSYQHNWETATYLPYEFGCTSLKNLGHFMNSVSNLSISSSS